jgi:DNA repair protein RadB
MVISSGNKEFDGIIDKGYGNYITSFYGSAGTGKTTFCLMAAIEQAKQNKKVLYFDTEINFSLERLKQMITTDLEKILDNIIVIKIKGFKGQQDQIKKIPSMIESGKISLVIIDSIGHYYRSLVKKEFDLANSMLNSQLRILDEISKNIPVIITNQVYTDLDEHVVKMVGNKIIEKYSHYIIRLDNDIKRSIQIMLPSRKSLNFVIENSGIKLLDL